MTAPAGDGAALLALYETSIDDVYRYASRLTGGDRVAPSPEEALAVTDLGDASIEYVPVWPYTNRIWELRADVSSYDACYVAVAEAHRCPLVTTDRRLARAPGLRTTVIVPPASASS